MENNPHSLGHSNMRVFYHIAEEAYVAMDKDLKSSKKTKNQR